MDPEPSLYAIGIVLCLVLLAFTSAVDAALTAISRHRLSVMHEESAKRATMIRHLLADPYRFKAAILLLNTATVIAATAFMLMLTYELAIGWRFGALTL
nr:CNNM domain-containing protein [Chloroflexota bacterium]